MKTLCQDCLRVVTVDVDEYKESTGKGMCPCGGEVCHCKMCMLSIKDLTEWDQSVPFSLGLQVTILSWTPTDGCVVAA